MSQSTRTCEISNQRGLGGVIVLRQTRLVIYHEPLTDPQNSMGNIYAIVTHHGSASESAEAAVLWRIGGVCAIGWSRYSDLREDRPKLLRERPFAARMRELFLGIRKGDVILAYAKNSMIAYVGTAKTRYAGPTNDNDVASQTGYCHQVRVDWWSDPHHFIKDQLPGWLQRQLGNRGPWVIRLDLGDHGFEKTIEIIKHCALSTSGLEEIEDLAKVALRKYLYSRFDIIESGLTIISAEKSISESDRPDFIALDEEGNRVLIECKGSAHIRDIEQLARYGKQLSGRRPRLMLVAFEFDEACKRMARSRHFELYECGVKFTRLEGQ